MHIEDADGMANSVDPYQTAPKEQSGLGLHSLLMSVPKLSIFMVIHSCCLLVMIANENCIGILIEGIVHD